MQNCIRSLTFHPTPILFWCYWHGHTSLGASYPEYIHSSIMVHLGPNALPGVIYYSCRTMKYSPSDYNITSSWVSLHPHHTHVSYQYPSIYNLHNSRQSQYVEQFDNVYGRSILLQTWLFFFLFLFFLFFLNLLETLKRYLYLYFNKQILKLCK